MIKRDILDLIKNTINTFPVTLITGPRQVGKTTLLKYLLNNDKFKYLSFDDIRLISEATLDPYVFLNKYKYPLIIDEAQLIPSLFSEINTMVNKSKTTIGNKESNGMYILSGSNKGQLLLQTKESLAGRMAYLEMLPLSLNEILNRKNKAFNFDIKYLSQRSNELEMSEKKLFEYIYRGFLPGLYDNENTQPSTFYSSYLNSYLKKDLKQIIEVKNEIVFNNFLMILASNIGQELEYSSYSKKVGVAVNTIKSWIEALVKTGVIFLLQPYNDRSISKRVVKRPKMYFFDTGLAAYLINMPDAQTLWKSQYKGAFFECFVINELRKSFINHGIYTPIYYYRDTNQNEIDFVYIQAGQLIKIDAKCGQDFNLADTKRFNALKSSNFKEGHRAIICSGTKLGSLSDGTIIIPFSAI